MTGPENDLTGDAAVGSGSAKKDDSVVSAEAQDWRVPLISYLRNPGRDAERNIRRLAFKYVLRDDELYRRTAEDLLLKCLDSDQARVAMGEVHEGICGTHQSAHKMKCYFESWGFDFIGQINPPSSKGHRFVLVATDYFTKWTEAVPLKNMTRKEVIEFITEHIIHRFGIPQTLTTDQGSSFISKEVRAFAKSYKIKLINSSPYYA